MSGIVSGQDSLLQIGLASTWGRPTGVKYRVPFTTESLKGTPNYKSVDALVGAKTDVDKNIMSMKADGGFSTYLTPDLAKFLFYCALGRELPRTVDGSGQQKHSYVPIPSGECRNLPPMTVEVDRILERALYNTLKVNDWKISAQQEDYVMFELNGMAHSENLQSIILKGAASAFAAGVITVPDGLISVDDEFNGRVGRAYLDCDNEYWFKVTDSAAATDTLTVASYPDPLAVAPDITGWTVEVYDWSITKGILLSTLEYLRFVHGRVWLEGSISDLIVRGASGGMGKAGDTVFAVPTTVNGTTAPLVVEARNERYEPIVYRLKTLGTALVHTGTLTFDDAPLAGSAEIPSIFSAANVFNSAAWEIVEEMYDEITDFNVGGNNSIKDGKFGANGSMYQTELNPQKREYTFDCTMNFTKRYSELRKKKMLSGAKTKIRLEFITQINDIDGPQNTSVDSTGHPYRVVITMPRCVHEDGIPNISGPDEPTVSAKFTALEIPGVQEAITIDVYDDVAADIRGEETVRTDGLV